MLASHYNYVVDHLNLQAYELKSMHGLKYFSPSKLAVSEYSPTCYRVVERKSEFSSGVLFDDIPSREMADEIISFILRTEIAFI